MPPSEHGPSSPGAVIRHQDGTITGVARQVGFRTISNRPADLEAAKFLVPW